MEKVCVLTYGFMGHTMDTWLSLYAHVVRTLRRFLHVQIGRNTVQKLVSIDSTGVQAVWSTKLRLRIRHGLRKEMCHGRRVYLSTYTRIGRVILLGTMQFIRGLRNISVNQKNVTSVRPRRARFTSGRIKVESTNECFPTGNVYV